MTTYYCTGSNSYTTCDVAPSYDLSLIDATALISLSTGSLSFVEVGTFDVLVTNMSTQTLSVSLNIDAVTAGSEFRYRLQQINSGTCAAMNSSSYSSTYSTSGIKTDNLSLTWTAGTAILRISVELRRTGAPTTPRVLDINIDTNCFVTYTPVAPGYTRKLSIVRDLWWMNASGTDYLINENNQLSSYNTGLYRSIYSDVGTDDSKFIQIRSDSATAASVPYYFRVSHDHIVPNTLLINLRCQAGVGGGVSMTFDLYINGVSLGTLVTTNSATPTTTAVTIILTDTQRKAILDARQDEPYDYFRLQMVSSQAAVVNGSKIYDIEIYYYNDLSEEYFVHQSSIPGASVNWFYPVGISAINTTWKNDAGTVLSSSDLSLISYSGYASGADSRYIQCWNEPPQNGTTRPSGHLTLNFDVGNTYSYNSNINRANLYLRLSLPNSGNGNQRDVFQVIGHNPTIGSGNIIWASGGIVETSGFRVFNSELCWTNPWLRSVPSLSGNRASAQFRSAESLRNLSLRLIGLPSGTQLSAASLYVESQPSNSLTLKTLGGPAVRSTLRSYPSGYSNTGGTIYNRYRGYTFIQNSGMREIFNKGYYQFKEIAGPQITSEVNNASGMFVNTTTLASGNPTRTHYYRSPTITIHDDWRNAIFVENSSTTRSTHIDFEDRIHASGEHSFFGHITSKSNRFQYDNNYGNILLYRGNGTNHEYIVNILNEQLNYNIFSPGGAISETLSLNLGTLNNVMFLGTFTPSSGGANGQASFYTFDFNGGFSSASASGFTATQYSNSYTSVGSRNLTSSISQMDSNYDGWIHELGFANRILSFTDAVNLWNNRYNGFNYQNQTTVLNSGNNNYLEFEFNPASGNVSETLTVPFQGQDSNIRNAFPGFYELSGPQYTNYSNIPVNPSAVQLEMIVSHNTNHPSGAYLTSSMLVLDNGVEYETFGGQVLLPSSVLSTVKTTLFTKNTLPVNYVNWDSLSNKFLVQFKHQASGFYSELKIHSMNMKFDALMVADSSNSSVNLYTAGASTNNYLNLYTKSNPASSLNLYIKGQAPYYSGNVNLYTSGIYGANSYLNLYTINTAPPKASGNLTLMTYSTTNSGLYKAMNLYTTSELDPNGGILNLVTTGAGGSLNSYLNLITNAASPSAFGSLDLTLKNGVSGVNSSTNNRNLNLYLYSNPYTPASSQMNLYIGRNAEGVSASLPMFMKVGTRESGNLNLYTKGSTAITNNMNMYISGREMKTGQLDVYAHGF